MVFHVRWRLVFVALAVVANPAALRSEEKKVTKGNPRPELRQRVDALERFVESRNDEALARYFEQQLSPAARESKSKEQWLADLKGIRRQCADFGTVQIAPTGEWSWTVRFGGGGRDTQVELELDGAPPHLVRGLRLGKAEPPAGKQKTTAPSESRTALTWDNLRARLETEQADGFSGSVLVIRDDNVVLNEAYGMANRERKIPNRPETIFAIGSTPIDFTKVAVLKLEDMGKLKGSDPITKFVPNVPDDKKGITIEHLMTGRSGLRNFHGRPTDADLDNSWIDRDTAVRRILDDELLFPPGTDRAHSHSAFGLLAAIVEMVSGEPIGAFYKRYLFEPAGMTRTSLYEDIKAPQEEIAVGYGGGAYSTVNSPNHWGRTSWLVMGSGGMVSTTGDLHRFNKALREGKILSPLAAKKYWSPGGGVGLGASQNGFVTANTEGPDSMMFLCSNVIGRERTEGLIQDLAALVNKPKFRLGISMRVEPDGIVVDKVEPDSPAQRAGLQIGDKIVAISGVAVDEGGPERIRELVSTGKSVELTVSRAGQNVTVKVTPTPGP